ncbi:MAG: hypothetical protein WCO21_01285 [bacterium]|nr:hypothetical protein [Candidatus Jorgensenbacteria bacterium]
MLRVVYFHFTELETKVRLPPEEHEIDDEDEFDVFTFQVFLAKIGVRSMQPFTRNGKKMLLAFITDEKGNQLFYNAHNF